MGKRRVFVSDEERKEAQCEYSRQYRLRNKEKVRQRDRERYYRDHEESKKRQRDKWHRYAFDHPDIRKLQREKWDRYVARNRPPETLLDTQQALNFTGYSLGSLGSWDRSLTDSWDAHDRWIEQIDFEMYLERVAVIGAA